MLSINESHMAVPTKKLQSLIAFLGQTLHCTLHSSSDIVIKLLVLVNFSASVSQSCITFGTSRKQTYIICCLSAFLRCSSRKPRSFRLSPVLSVACTVLLQAERNTAHQSSLTTRLQGYWFSNTCKATTVTHTKRIDRNLLRKETSFVCYTSSVLRKSRHMKQKEKITYCC